MKSAIADTVRMFFVVIGIFVFMLSACGGGTSGTGGTGSPGGSSEFRGLILSATGAPVINATVILEENDSFAVTDENGAWKLLTDYDASSATFAIQTAAFEIKTSVSDLPKGPKEVELNFKVDTNQRSVKVTKKKVKRRRPRPQPTIDLTLTPEVSGTPSVSPTVSGTPSVTPEVSITPTVTGTVTLTATITVTPTSSPTPKI